MYTCDRIIYTFHFRSYKGFVQLVVHLLENVMVTRYGSLFPVDQSVTS